MRRGTDRLARAHAQDTQTRVRAQRTRHTHRCTKTCIHARAHRTMHPHTPSPEVSLPVLQGQPQRPGHAGEGEGGGNAQRRGRGPGGERPLAPRGFSGQGLPSFEGPRVEALAPAASSSSFLLDSGTLLPGPQRSCLLEFWHLRGSDQSCGVPSGGSGFPIWKMRGLHKTGLPCTCTQPVPGGLRVHQLLRPHL